MITIEKEEIRLAGELKRVRLPGLKIHAHCPQCGCTTTKDYGRNDYLSYPSGDDEIEMWFYCDCGHEWLECTLRFKFDISITPVHTPKKAE